PRSPSTRLGTAPSALRAPKSSGASPAAIASTAQRGSQLGARKWNPGRCLQPTSHSTGQPSQTRPTKRASHVATAASTLDRVTWTAGRRVGSPHDSRGRRRWRIGKELALEPGASAAGGDQQFNRKIYRFHRRGRSAVRSEWRLITATHNLLRL